MRGSDINGVLGIPSSFEISEVVTILIRSLNPFFVGLTIGKEIRVCVEAANMLLYPTQPALDSRVLWS